jgi:hypothetical protein
MGQITWAVLSLIHLAMGLQGDKYFRGLIFSTRESVVSVQEIGPTMLVKYDVLQHCNES